MKDFILQWLASAFALCVGLYVIYVLALLLPLEYYLIFLVLLVSLGLTIHSRYQ